jgi:hypothetical protein
MNFIADAHQHAEEPLRLNVHRNGIADSHEGLEKPLQFIIHNSKFIIIR